MNGSFSIPPLVDSSLIAVLALAVLIFFVFAMVLYLRRCISTVSQQYQDAADLSSAVTMLKADKEKTKAGITGVEIAARIIKECKPYCQGVHIMALGWESKIPALLEQAEI